MVCMLVPKPPTSLFAVSLEAGAPEIGTPDLTEFRTLVALALTNSSPLLGTPTLGQRHYLEPKGLEVSPLTEPLAEHSVRRLKAIGIGERQSNRGRHKAFTAAQVNELKAALEAELRRMPKFPKLPLQKISVRLVENQIKLKGMQRPSAIIITRQIVRPIHRKLHPKRPK